MTPAGDSVSVTISQSRRQQRPPAVEAQVWSVLTSQLAATSLFTDFTSQHLSQRAEEKGL